MSDWTECTWIEAANAVAAGTHEYEAAYGGASAWVKGCGFCESTGWFYRIREKARTITATHVRPLRLACHGSTQLMMQFDGESRRNAAYDAIRVAMEQQQ